MNTTIAQIHENLEANLIDRAKLLKSAEDSVELQSYIKIMCQRDPIYFFKMFMWTDRNPTIFPQKFGPFVPFILFDYQVEFVEDAWDAIQMGQKPVEERTEPTDVFSEKSRQTGFSWTFAGLQVYTYLFHNIKSLYISKKGDDTDKKGDISSHFEKIRFILKRMPQWILPEEFNKESGSEFNKFMLVSRKDGTGSMSGESANADAGRGGTYGFVIFDEMAFMEYAGAINMSISSATPCRFFNSTPNGEGNEYYRMRKLALEGKIRHHRCHWSEHPLYDQAWYEWRTKGMTCQQIAQELEMDYNTALKGKVYRDYKPGDDFHAYDSSLPLYAWIDNSHGGADPHAVILAQPKGDLWLIIEYCEFNCSPREMAEIMGKNPSIQMSDRQLEFYDKYRFMKTPIYVSDPYDTHSTVGDDTIFQYYQNEGIFLNIPANRDKKAQIRITQSNIHRIKTSNICTDFNSVIQNARYPEVKEGSMRITAADTPIHDWTSHGRSALEYGIVYATETRDEEQKEEDEEVFIEYKDPITGVISYKRFN